MKQERSETRRTSVRNRVRNLALTGILTAAGTAVGMEAISRFSNPSSNDKPPEPTPTLVAKPSPSPTPTESPRPTPTESPTSSPELKVASIEGLRFDPATKKYYAEAGNPYGLEVNAYAGEQVIYMFGNERTSGVVLTKEVVRVFSRKANTPEAVAQEKWQIPLPLDPRDAENPVRISEDKPTRSNILTISDVDPKVTFVSPFLEETSTLSGVSSVGGSILSLIIPSSMSLEERELFLIHTGDLEIKIGSKVSLGQTLFDNVKDNLKSPPFKAGTQAIITIGTKNGSRSIFWSNILKVGDQAIFLAKNQ